MNEWCINGCAGPDIGGYSFWSDLIASSTSIFIANTDACAAVMDVII